MTSIGHEMKNAYIGYGYTPSSNTLLYLPLTENANDYSWNGRNCTAYASVSFTSDWAYFSWSAYNTNFIEFPSSFYPWTSFTISLWIKREQNDRELRMFSDWWSNYRRILWATVSSWYMTLLFGNGNTSQSDWWSIQTYSANTWYNYVLVKNWASATLYRNWELVGTHTFSYNSNPGWLAVWEYWIGTIRTASSSHIPWTWYVKDYIIESTLWTANDALNYHNRTKSLYWIS